MMGIISRKLSLRQAVMATVIACCIGLTLSAIQIGILASQSRTRAKDQLSDLLSVSTASASAAVWSYDHGAANQIVHGLVSIYGVESAEIYSERDNLMARAERHYDQTRSFLTVLTRPLYKDIARSEVTLRGTDIGERDVFLGRMNVVLATGVLGDDLLSLAVSALVTNVAQSLLLGLLLAFAFDHLVTRPLAAVRNALSDVPIDNPAAALIPIPNQHKADELGQLVDQFNSFLTLLDSTQSELRALATRDSLTGLPNRAVLLSRLNRDIETCRDSGGSFALVFLDLDRFKTVNDSLGHSQGDALLACMARRLEAFSNENAMIGRYGGDEFLMLVDRFESLDDLRCVTESLLSEIGQPVVLGNETLNVSGSIGVAVYPEDGADADLLLAAADTAMYSAKRASSGSYRFFTPNMSEQARQRLVMENSLHRALKNGEFELFYQPKVRCIDLVPIGSEALIRWFRHDRMIPPSEFIGVAEETGIINAISAWVVERACRQIAEWSEQHQPLPVAVNVNAAQFVNPDFTSNLRNTIERYGIVPSLLEIEVTESVLMRDADAALATLRALREAGIRVAIDDFGTGYSSLNYLRQLPIDILKLDRSFIAGLPKEAPVVDAVLVLSRHLGLHVVAEGVETAYQRAWLVDHGCEVLQGWLFSPAVRAEVFCERYLKTRRRLVSIGDAPQH